MVFAAFAAAGPGRQVARLLKPHRRNLAVAAVAFSFKHSPVWIMPFVTAAVIDTVVDHAPLSSLFWVAVATIAIVAQNYPVTLLYVRRQSRALRSVEASLRTALTRRLQELSIGYHKRTNAGVLHAKVVRDVESLVEALRQTFDTSLGAVTTLVGAIVLIALRVPQFVLVFAVVVPAAALLVSASRRPMRSSNTLFRTEVERMSVRVTEMAHLIPVTRAHASEESEAQRVEAAVSGVRRAGLELDRVNGRFGAVSWIGFQVLSIGCLMVAAWLAWHGVWGMGAGDVVLLASYFVQLTGAVSALIAVAPFVTRGFEGVRSLGEILAAEELEPTAGRRPIANVEGRISFENVVVAYAESPNKPALRGVSLAIAPGETIALVGRSGSGKSTLLNALIGFVEPTSGRIEVDGKDLATIDLRSLRKAVGVVPQEPILFEGTVRDNVTYGNDLVDDSRAIEALKGAHAWEFVEQAGGLDMSVGDNGGQLSGGQRQRLTIARALYRDPRILILDEATSALDPESELLVRAALETLMDGRTTLVVAHRLSTIARADRIVVLAHGEIAQIGSHEELLGRPGVYRHLHGLNGIGRERG